MTDLTEKWKKGELPVGSYYASYLGEPRVWLYRDKQNQTYDLEYEIYEVLEKVPSYEEWQASYNCMLENEVLRLKNAQLKKQINHVLRTQARQFVDNQNLQVKAEKAKDVVNIDTARQIIQLKELLKECRLAVFDYPPYDLASDKIRLMNRIDEVLR